MRPALAAALAATVLFAAGCDAGGAPAPAGAATSRAPGAPATDRIAVMAPGAAEILDALGAADLVVGAGDFVTYPPSIARLPKLGAYDAPNLERIAELRATLLVTSASEAGRPAIARLRDLGVDALELPMESGAEAFAALETLGMWLSREARAGEVAASMRARLEEVRRRAGEGGPPPRTLLVVGREPLFLAGPGSFLDELLLAAGGENVLADAGAPYRMGSLEAVLARRPEVIVDLADNTGAVRFGRHPGRWAEWAGTVPAVAAGRVFHVHPERLAIPGPRLPEMAALLARMVRPERFDGPPPDSDLGPLTR
jgi:iron complex transport system substrate-binding protein